MDTSVAHNNWPGAERGETTVELTDMTTGVVTLQVSPRMAQMGIPHGFTTRPGGVSQGIFSSLNLAPNRGDDPANVRENYRRVCRALGVEESGLVFSRQVHRDDVRRVTAADMGKGLDRAVDYEADALVTDMPGVTLVVFGADCVTMLLCDPVRRVVAAAHAGWRGTALGIAQKTVERMAADYGCRRQDILAAIGPCIGKCCFETHGEVPTAMTAALGDAALPYIKELGGDKFKVDLKGLNALWLTRAGVPGEQIDISPDCTMCRPDKYWSHRYTKGERGSQAALISLT